MCVLTCVLCVLTGDVCLSTENAGIRRKQAIGRVCVCVTFKLLVLRRRAGGRSDGCSMRSDGCRRCVSLHRNAGCAELALDGGCRVSACVTMTLLVCEAFS